MKIQLFFKRKFTFQSAASASSFHSGLRFSGSSADWGEMTCDVNYRTHASVSYTFYTIIPVYNTVFLVMIIQQKMFAVRLGFNHNNQQNLRH